MVIDGKTIVSRPRDLESNFVDDEDLQATLARSRRVEILKMTKLSLQFLAAKVAAERVRDEAEAVQEIIMHCQHYIRCPRSRGLPNFALTANSHNELKSEWGLICTQTRLLTHICWK
jgi:hypothetical protein